MNGHIHREIFGSGKALVMLHGWAMHSGVWRQFARRLGQHYQVICLDLPGHGRSDLLAAFDVEHVVEALLAAVPVEQFSLLGWSLGATLAIEMAGRQPQRLSKLLLLAGNPHFVQSENWPGMPVETLDSFAELLAGDVQQTLARFLALQVNGLAHGKVLLQQLKAAVEECSAPSVETLEAGLAMLKFCDLRDSLVRVQQPVCVILGERDRLVPAVLAEQLLQIRPDAELTVLAKAGHAPFLSHADELVEIIRRFVQ